MDIRQHLSRAVIGSLVLLSMHTMVSAQTGPNANARSVEFWDPADLPLAYVIHEDAAPVLTDGSDFAAIHQGFTAWTGLPDVTLSATYLGTTPQTDGDGLDGVNLVSFQDSEFYSIYGNYVLAVGITTSFTETTDFRGRTVAPGQIVDADMLFNPNRTFSTDAGGSGPDLASVAVHEAGHLFGFSHSCVVSSTMFPALPKGSAARSLETDDRVLAFMAYPEPEVESGATRLEGALYDGSSGLPVPGAIVFAISVALGDTSGCQFTLPDGTYRFVGLAPGGYRIWVHPLDGSAGANGVTPSYINELVRATANTAFLPEWWDTDESATDDRGAHDVITLNVGDAVTGIDIVTNVDAVPPALVRRTPGDGAIDVRADTWIAVEFSEPVDFESVRANFRLEMVTTDGGVGIAGSLVTLGDGSKLVFDPAALLEYDATYRLTLGASVQDRFGNSLGSPSVSTFDVQPRPPLSIRSISPIGLAPGVVAVIDGEGFDTGDPAANVVHFDAVTASAFIAGPASIAVRVPDGLEESSVRVRVTTPDGATSNEIEAIRIPSFEIARGAPSGAAELPAVPRALALLPDGTHAFVATDSGVSIVVTGTSAPDYLAVRDLHVQGGTSDVAATPDGTRAYAVGRESRLLVAIDAQYGDLTAPAPTFGAVLDELPLGGTPLSIAIDGPGQRVFVSTIEGRIQMWDVRLGNATYHQQIGEVVLPTTPTGNLVVDRARDLLYVLTAGGQLLAYELDSFTSDDPPEPVSIELGAEPVSVSLDPVGDAVYVVDAQEEILVLDGTTLEQTAAVSSGGAPVAFAVSPLGGLGYLANRAIDAVQVVGLDPSRTGYLTVTNDFGVGQRPVDLVVSPDGSFTYVVEEGVPRLTVIGIGFGPVITSITPTRASPGDIVVIAGSGFAPSDERVSTPYPPSRVYFGDDAIEPVSSTGSDLWVRVPSGFAGGTVRVGTRVEQAAVGQVELLSNPFVLRGFSEDEEVRSAPLQTAVLLGSENGYPWSEPGLTGVLAAAPDGRTLLVSDAARGFSFVDVDPVSRSYGQILSTFVSPVSEPRGITFTPAGDRVFLVFGQNEPILVIDSGRASPTFGTLIAEVDFTWVPDFCFNPNRLVPHPNGDIIVVEDACEEKLYGFDTDGSGSLTGPLFAISDPALGSAEDVVMHPTGRALYYASSDGAVLVFDFDPFSETTHRIVASLPTSGIPRALATTPNGDELLVVTRSSEPSGDYVLEVWNTVDSIAPVLAHRIVVASTEAFVRPTITVSPRGNRALVDLGAEGTLYLDLSEEALASGHPELDRVVLNGSAERLGISYAADPRRFFSAAAGDSVLRMTEVTGAITATLVSGGDQTGTAGSTLPAPIRYRVTSTTNGWPVSGATAEVRVIGGGGSLANGGSYQWLSTDTDGEVEVWWTLGAAPDIDTVNPANRLRVTFTAGTSTSDEITARAVADDAELPLRIVEIRPADGTEEVAKTTSVQVVFSRAVDRSTISPTRIQLEGTDSGLQVDTAYGYADADRRVSLIPVDPLDDSATYTFVIGSGIRDLSGGELQNPQNSTFLTEGPPDLLVRSVDPPAAQVGVPVVIGGEGFDPIAANNLVTFNGASTPAISSTANSLLVVVPVGAATGELVVDANGQRSQPLWFGVLVPQPDPTDEVIKTEPTGVNVRSIAVLPDGSAAYASSRETDSVVILDLGTLETVGSVLVGDAPVALAAHPDGSTVYSANWGSGDVSVIDTGTNTVLQSIAVGEGPVDLVAAPAGDRLYVVNQSDETLSVIDIGSTHATYHTVVATVPTGSTTRGAAITPDGSLLYLGTEDGFVVFDLDPSSYGVVASVPTGATTRGAAITPDGTLLLLVTAPGDLLVIDITAAGGNAVVATVPTGVSSRGAAITPDGTLLYVFADDSDDILVYFIDVTSSAGVLPSTDRLGQSVVDLVLVDRFAAGRNPVFIAFDPTGSGLGIVSNDGLATVTFFNALVLGYGEPIGGEAIVEPRTLNLESNGRFVTATLELQRGFYVRNIELETIRLNGIPAAGASPVAFQDEDQDGQEELVLKFDRADFQEILPQGERVPIEITGRMSSIGRSFALQDTIRTVRPTVIFPRGGETLHGGGTIEIVWTSPQGYVVGSVNVHVSMDDGASWNAVALGIPDHGHLAWTIPVEPSESCLVLVSLVDQRGDPLGAGMSPSTFAVLESPVPVLSVEVSVLENDGDALLRWSHSGHAGLAGFEVLRAQGSRQADDSRWVPIARLETTPSAPNRLEYRDTDVLANQVYWYALEEIGADGSRGVRHGPYRFERVVRNVLEQNVPNAFNPVTSIRFSLATAGPTRLAVYDVSGRLVRILVDEILLPDSYAVEWDGTDQQGRPVSSGTYLYRLVTGDFTMSRKMSLVR